MAGADRVGHGVQRQEAQIRLGGEGGSRVRVGIGGDHDLGEDPGDLTRGLAVERPVAGDDAAEGAERVTGQRLAVGVGHVIADGHAAGWRA